jgi:hypothetical protein
VNVLANYWWTPPAEGRGAPHDAFLHAVLALRALPDAHRAAWKALFDHYVFGDAQAATEHLPPGLEGILGALSREEAERLCKLLGQKISS